MYGLAVKTSFFQLISDVVDAQEQREEMCYLLKEEKNKRKDGVKDLSPKRTQKRNNYSKIVEFVSSYHHAKKYLFLLCLHLFLIIIFSSWDQQT